MENNILITGINGFIGKFLKDYIEKQNIGIVYGIGKRKQKNQERYLNLNISNEDFLKKIKSFFPKCNIVIHLAASLDMTNGYQNITSNCIGTFNICRLAEAWNSKKIIYISSLPVIGVPVQLPINEEHTINPQSIYHITKYAGEQMVNMYCNKKITGIILRIPSPIGHGMNMNTLLPSIIKKCIENKNIILYGTGKRKQNYIDVRDVVDAIMLAIKYDKCGIFNIAAKNSISNLDLAKKCIKITNSSSKIVFSDIEDREENFKWDVSIQKAEKELGYIPHFDIDESIKWIYESVRS